MEKEKQMMKKNIKKNNIRRCKENAPLKNMSNLTEKNRKMKQKGITIISLIITIIIMLILLAVTINVSLNGGIFNRAKKTKISVDIMSYKLDIETLRRNVEIKDWSEGMSEKEYLDEYQKELENDPKLEKATIDRVNNKIIIITEEKYVFEITKEETSHIGQQGTTKPEDLNESNTKFIYNPTNWTNGEVKVKIETIETENTLQYSTDNKTWYDYKGEISIYKNTSIYARLIKNYQVGNIAVGNITNIDKLPPIDFQLNATSTINSITITGATEDAKATNEYGNSGIAKYYFSKDNGATWVESKEEKKTSYTFNDLEENTSYNLKMKAVDKAGNEKISEILIMKTKAKATNTLTVVATSGLEYNKTANMVSATNAQGEIYYSIGTQITGANYKTVGNTTIPTTEGRNAGIYTVY